MKNVPIRPLPKHRQSTDPIQRSDNRLGLSGLILGSLGIGIVLALAIKVLNL